MKKLAIAYRADENLPKKSLTTTEKGLKSR